MKRLILFVFAVSLSLPLFSQVRGHINIPDLEGFVTLKCDFHIHTVFSDGLVWPTVRVDEAYSEGLDAISITDHIEYRPFRSDVVSSHNRSYEIALPRANARGIILIRGSEITRSMPPGHLNAIFVTDADELDKPDYMDALRAAKAQGAFIFWNHPGWASQQPDTTLWFDIHTQLLEQGIMQGIEIVNGPEYYPEGQQWCLEKNLTMIGNSDVHTPMQHFAPGEYRTMTLVFARTATAESIHEALKERRTAVFSNNKVMGKEVHLKELFERAIERTIERTGNNVRISFVNNSDFTFQISKANHDARLTFREFTIVPNGRYSFSFRAPEGSSIEDVNLIVDNFLVGANRGMRYTIKF